MVLTPSGVGSNDRCTTRPVKVRNGRVVINETLSVYVVFSSEVNYILLLLLLLF